MWEKWGATYGRYGWEGAQLVRVEGRGAKLAEETVRARALAQPYRPRLELSNRCASGSARIGDPAATSVTTVGVAAARVAAACVAAACVATAAAGVATVGMLGAGGTARRVGALDLR